jgi:6-phosphogluconolactonase
VAIDKPDRRQFFKAGAVGALGALVFRNKVWAHQSRELTLYVGTYTNAKSEGIYVYRMDAVTGQLKRVSSVKSVNPSFLAIDQSKRHLYAVNEVADFAGKTSGAVSAFAIESETGNLRFLNQQASLGADPCHLTLDRRGKFLLVANYTSGNLAVLRIQRDGSLANASEMVQHQGSSIKEQQKGPHAHCVILDASERHALAADLGIDKVMIYRFDSSEGKLKPAIQSFATLQAGAGPRHLTLHPRGKYAYVINELDSTMSAFRYDPGTGALKLLQTVSTLPKDFSGRSYCADLHVSPSGKFLYGSNRGHDSIVTFAIEQSTGRLQYLENVSTKGKWPRNFSIDPSGRFLLVANQHTDNVVTLKVDAKTGRLSDTGHDEQIPTPVCLKFI